MRSVSIIIPIYNGEKYLANLKKCIETQVYDGKIEVIIPVSSSKDNSLEVAQNLFDIVYEVENFNHGRTRHEAALKANHEVLVFMTQDVTPYDEQWLKNLVCGLSKDVVASYSRQIAYEDASPLERLVRVFNYPDKDRLCNKESKDIWKRKTIFYSDAASATDRDFYFMVDGYNFDCNTNEDVVYASKVINTGKSILYNSKSKVLHSHDFKIRDLWNRYYSIGKFEGLNKELFLDYSSNGEGVKLVKFLVKNLLIEKQIIELCRFLFIECPIRLIAYKKGYYGK